MALAALLVAKMLHSSLLCFEHFLAKVCLLYCYYDEFVVDIVIALANFVKISRVVFLMQSFVTYFA